MGKSTWFGQVALAIAAAVVIAGLIMMLVPGGTAPARASPSPPTSGPSTYLNLTIAYDPTSQSETFTTPSISIASHTLVTVRITNHDTSVGTLLVPWDNHVIGTVGGTAWVSFGSGAYTVSSLPANAISHTFTVHDALYNISVPIPPALSSSVPSVVTFQLEMNWAETTTWGCVNACHTGLMAADRMYGPLVVTA